MKNKSGFTIVEVVVSIGILGVIGAILALTLSQSFQGNNKSALIGNIKQSGQVALSIIDQTLRNANSIVCPPKTKIGSSNLTLELKDGRIVRFTAIPEPVNKLYNGHLVQDSPILDKTKSPVEFCDYLDTQPPSAILLLTDKSNITSGISLKAVDVFSITKTPGYNDIVEIKLKIGQSAGAKSSFDNSTVNPIRFQTTVQLRK